MLLVTGWVFQVLTARKKAKCNNIAKGVAIFRGIQEQLMKRIDGTPKNVRELFTGAKYTLHYYQREYRWGTKQVEELFYDEDHPLSKVPEYGHYFLGSVVLTEDENAIIDGQQRLTSLTLLLIYLYHHLDDVEDKAEVLNLFWSKRAGEKTFTISHDERTECLRALKDNDVTYTPGQDAPESVRNIYARYHEIQELLPDEIKESTLPFFKDWLLDNVDFIRIIAKTEQDAHKIFVSMNDRGLSLTSTEMLKGFLLSEIDDNAQRNKANDIWKETMLTMQDLGKNEDSNFLKTWLRAQYAETLREGKKDAENKDWDIIGTAFHKWAREHTGMLGLKKSDDYNRFVAKEMVTFAKAYSLLLKASISFDKEYEYVFYNANREFTFQYQLILAAINPDDAWDVIERKIKTVSCFLDQYIALRVFNYKKIGYNDRKNAIFALTKRIRRKSLSELVDILYKEIVDMEFKLDGVLTFRLNQFTGRYVLHILARLTSYMEDKAGVTKYFEDYVSRSIKNPYDIEHVWADHFERHQSEFKTNEEFELFRNKIGGMVLLPRDINRSLQDNTYEEKLPHYKENLLAWSLNPTCHKNNPQFLRFLKNENLERLCFPIETFDKDAITSRQEFYRELSARIWDPEKIRGFLP